MKKIILISRSTSAAKRNRNLKIWMCFRNLLKILFLKSTCYVSSINLIIFFYVAKNICDFLKQNSLLKHSLMHRFDIKSVARVDHNVSRHPTRARFLTFIVKINLLFLPSLKGNYMIGFVIVNNNWLKS